MIYRYETLGSFMHPLKRSQFEPIELIRYASIYKVAFPGLEARYKGSDREVVFGDSNILFFEGWCDVFMNFETYADEFSVYMHQKTGLNYEYAFHKENLTTAEELKIYKLITEFDSMIKSTCVICGTKTEFKKQFGAFLIPFCDTCVKKYSLKMAEKNESLESETTEKTELKSEKIKTDTWLDEY